MPTRCPATNRDGQPCSGQPDATGWCRWHDPARVEERRQNAIKGGRAKSNVSRARKAIVGKAMTPGELGGVLSDVLRRTIDGDLEPGVANAAANLGRAMLVVREATEVDDRLDALEKALATYQHHGRRYGA